MRRGGRSRGTREALFDFDDVIAMSFENWLISFV